MFVAQLPAPLPVRRDRSCVGALEHDPSAAAIVRATLSVARDLGLAPLAAGVESASQLSLLRAEGCCIAQGSCFSPPVHPREVAAMIDAAAVTRDINGRDHEVQITG